MKSYVYHIVFVLSMIGSHSVAQVWFQGGVGSGYNYDDTLYCSIDATVIFSNSTQQGSGFALSDSIFCVELGNFMFQSTDSVSGFAYSEVALCDTNNVLAMFTSSSSESGGNFNQVELCSTTENSMPFLGSSGSGVKQSLATCVIPLPVELLLFEAVPNGDEVILYWSTASEIDNSYFIVERSVDLQYWGDILEVEGAGFSNEIINYETVDESPEKGVSYYRLRQVDFDGQFSYSQIRKVVFDDKTTVAINAYPNPARDVITFTGEIEEYGIFNMMGQNISNQIWENRHDESKLIIDISSLSKGVYFLQTEKGEVCKFNVQ